MPEQEQELALRVYPFRLIVIPDAAEREPMEKLSKVGGYLKNELAKAQQEVKRFTAALTHLIVAAGLSQSNLTPHSMLMWFAIGLQN